MYFLNVSVWLASLHLALCMETTQKKEEDREGRGIYLGGGVTVPKLLARRACGRRKQKKDP